MNGLSRRRALVYILAVFVIALPSQSASSPGTPDCVAEWATDDLLEWLPTDPEEIMPWVTEIISRTRATDEGDPISRFSCHVTALDDAEEIVGIVNGLLLNQPGTSTMYALLEPVLARVPDCIKVCPPPPPPAPDENECEGTSDCGWVSCQPWIVVDIIYDRSGQGWVEAAGGVSCEGTDAMRWLSIDGQVARNGYTADVSIAGASQDSFTTYAEEVDQCPANNCKGHWTLDATAAMQLPHESWSWYTYPDYCYTGSGGFLYCDQYSEQWV